MRIVHVADYYMPTLGYQESILPRYHARHGHDVHVVTSDRYTDVPHYDSSWRPLLGDRLVGAGTSTRDGVVVHRLRGSLERRHRIVLRGLAREMAQIRPDAIFGHGTTNYTAFRLARLAKRLGVPLYLDCHMLFTVQDTSIAGRAFYRVLRAATARFMTPAVTTYFGVAEEACDFLTEAQGIPASAVQLLPLGLDTDIFSPRPEGASALRSRLDLPDDALVVMQTGKLTPDKGPHILTEAIAPLMATDPRVHLVMVGGGAPGYMEEVARPLRSAGVERRLIQLPLVPASELAVYFSAADLVVFPGGSSLSCIEAAGCEATVVMTDLPAGQQREAAGIGITYPNENVEALRSTLAQLISAPERRASLSSNARESVMAKFSYASIAAALETAMEQASAAQA